MMETPFDIPGAFIGLITNDAGDRNTTLLSLERLWDAVQWAESIMPRDADVRRHLRAMAWTASSWLRGIFLTLAEHQWRYVPSWLRADLEEYFGSVRTTEIQECG